MTTLAAAKNITHLNWSPNSDALVWVEDREKVVVVDLAGKRSEIGEGSQPSWLGKDSVVFVRDHEIWTAGRSGGSVRKLFDRDAGFKDTSKSGPLGSPDGKRVLMVIRDVNRELTDWVPDAAFPVRHFYGVGDADSGTLQPINTCFYGGKAAWLGDGESFAHHEFDATGGARIHVNKLDGTELEIFRGYLPRLSPDGKRLATIDHEFASLQVAEIGGESISVALPEELKGGRFSNPPMWVSGTRLLLEAKGIILDFDLGKDPGVVRRVKVDVVRRGLPTLEISPDGTKVAIEFQTAEGGSEIRIIASSEWLDAKAMKAPATEPAPVPQAEAETGAE